MATAFETCIQLRNRQHREWEESPADTYHTRIGPGDEIAITIVEQEPFRVEKFAAIVGAVEEHGYYLVVRLHKLTTGHVEHEGWLSGVAHAKTIKQRERRLARLIAADCHEAKEITLWLAGPQDWGVVECRVLQKVYRQYQPSRDRDGTAWQRVERDGNHRKRTAKTGCQPAELAGIEND
jgi:protein involved in polysaccharide export with SLBB domain